jgi:metal-dependent amidase/aminoacylase/carboxypeptidase family protein
VKLIFQPAEENLPNGEIGGARRMLMEGMRPGLDAPVCAALWLTMAAKIGALRRNLELI